MYTQNKPACGWWRCNFVPTEQKRLTGITEEEGGESRRKQGRGAARWFSTATMISLPSRPTGGITSFPLCFPASYQHLPGSLNTRKGDEYSGGEEADCVLISLHSQLHLTLTLHSLLRCLTLMWAACSPNRLCAYSEASLSGLQNPGGIEAFRVWSLHVLSMGFLHVLHSAHTILKRVFRSTGDYLLTHGVSFRMNAVCVCVLDWTPSRPMCYR